MPDWLTHIGVAWLLCRLLYFRFPVFNPANTALVMVGSVLPDIVKLGILSDLFGWDVWDYLLAWHLPLGSFLFAGLICLLFEDRGRIFLFLSLGVFTHYLLDLLLIQVSGGIYLLFPFSWLAFHGDILPSDDYWITLVVLVAVLVVYLYGRWGYSESK